MKKVATTKMSSRGQVVIPEEVRKRLGLGAGSQFVVLGEGDVVVLKAIRAPSLKDFDRLVSQAESAVEKAGMTPEDIEAAIREVRGRA
ncbi:MAG: AbrB/MazE/SpoVT family DNA-binding domain-containing protein [Gemmatimonadales bacterium]|nr:MAG: AbrB/MazE/SpoVT family DNA-binding domain-containing protein [Gemmatimonadales bacterium]